MWDFLVDNLWYALPNWLQWLILAPCILALGVGAYLLWQEG
jgi:hypothetical protein